MAALRNRLPRLGSLLVAGLFALALPAFAQTDATLTLDRAALRATGLTRPADVLRRIAPDAFVTLDGFTWRERGAEQRWAVFVDGVQHRHPVTGAPDLNRLPLSVAHIERVRVYRAPHARLEVPGSVHLVLVETLTEATRSAAEAAVSLGNESGDPGPLRYVGDDAPNVDKIGPDVLLGAYGRTASVRGGFRLGKRKHFATDAALLPRVGALGAGYPVMDFWGAEGEVHAASLPAALRVQWTHATDFPYAHLRGSEWASRDTRLSVTAPVQIPLLGAPVLFRPAWQLARLSSRAASDLPLFEYNQYGIIATLHPADTSPAWTRAFRLRTGATLERTRVANKRRSTVAWQVGAGSRWFPVSRVSVLTAVRVYGRDRSIAPSATLLAYYGRRNITLQTGIDVSRRFLADSHTEAHRVRQGFPLTDLLPAFEDASTSLTTHAQIAYTASPTARIWSRLEYRQHARLGGTEPQEAPPFLWTTSATISPTSGRSGHTFSSFLQFGDAGERTPTHFATYDGHLLLNAPTDSPFILFARAELQSSVPSSSSASTIAGHLRIDAGLSKGFWSDRLQATLRLDNLLNQPVRYHPDGGTFDLALYFSMGLNLR